MFLSEPVKPTAVTNVQGKEKQAQKLLWWANSCSSLTIKQTKEANIELYSLITTEEKESRGATQPGAAVLPFLLTICASEELL